MYSVVNTASAVLFHGVTGSGKISAAHAYAQAVGLPFYPYDDVVGWLPEWQQRPVEEQQKMPPVISFRRSLDLEAWIAEAGQAAGAAETAAR